MPMLRDGTYTFVLFLINLAIDKSLSGYYQCCNYFTSTNCMTTEILHASHLIAHLAHAPIICCTYIKIWTGEEAKIYFMQKLVAQFYRR